MDAGANQNDQAMQDARGVSDDEEDKMEEEEPQNKRQHGGSRLSDQVDMENEPELVGYER